MEEGAKLKDPQEVESERASNTSDCSTPWIMFLKPLNNATRLVSIGHLSAGLQACEVKRIKSVTFSSAIVSLVSWCINGCKLIPFEERACGWWVGSHFSFQIRGWFKSDSSEFWPEAAGWAVVGQRAHDLGLRDEHGSLPFSNELCDLHTSLNLSQP